MNVKYSRTVISVYRGGCSGKYPTFAFAFSGSSKISKPSILTVPELAEIAPVKIFMVVLLPAPLGPKKPKTSPAFTSNEMLSTALTSP